MTMPMNEILRNINSLNIDEKSSILKYLIASMDEMHDENSDAMWAEVANKRLQEIKTNTVETTSWDEIKQKILAK